MSENTLLQARDALVQGGVIALPTDTVYGLGISPLHVNTLDALYNLKKRDTAKPIAWLLADASDLTVYGVQVPAYAQELARRFWPGALTLVVHASQAVPKAFQSAAGTIGLRVPDHDETRELIRLVGSPLAVTSANLSGEDAACSCATLDPTLSAHLAYVLPDHGFEPSGKASTVVDCTHEAPRVLRQGDIEIESVTN